MKNYLILHPTLDTFATIGERVLFFLADLLTTTAPVSTDFSQLRFAVTVDIQAIICEDITKFFAAEELPIVTWVSFRELLTSVSTPIAELLARSIQLARFYQDHHFCSRCGTPTQPHIRDTAMVCSSCNYHQYPRLQPCIITAIVKQDKNSSPKLLLAHHQRAKASGMYGLIAGFVEVGESLEACVHREVKEEVNLQVTNLRYFASQPWPFPSNLMLGFIADYESGDIIIQQDELIHADFFDFKHLPLIPQAGTIAYNLIMAVKNVYD